MKRFILLFTGIIFSSVSVFAADWQSIQTGIPDLELYLDRDSVKKINDEEYVYAVKFRLEHNELKTVYIKSNSVSDYIGVIRVENYNDTVYRPDVVLYNPHVFMKPVGDSFLSYPHKYVCHELTKVSKIVREKPIIRGAEKTFENEKTVSFSSNMTDENIAEFTDLNQYVKYTASKLETNWFPPKSGQNTQAIIILTTGSDGGLYNYRFAQSSGDDATDRSIISAVEKSVPYAKFSKIKRNSKQIKCQYVFDYKKFKKTVK